MPARQEATNARFNCPEALIAALHRKPRLVVKFFIGAGFLPMRHALFSRRRSPCPFGGPFRDPQRRLFLPKPEEAAHVLQSSVPALLSLPTVTFSDRDGIPLATTSSVLSPIGICGPLLRLTLCLKRNHRRNRIATSPKERSRRERYYGRGIGKAGIAEPHTILTFAPTNPDERIQEACQAQNSNWRPQR